MVHSTGKHKFRDLFFFVNLYRMVFQITFRVQQANTDCAVYFSLYVICIQWGFGGDRFAICCVAIHHSGNSSGQHPKRPIFLCPRHHLHLQVVIQNAISSMYGNRPLRTARIYGCVFDTHTKAYGPCIRPVQKKAFHAMLFYFTARIYSWCELSSRTYYGPRNGLNDQSEAL
jgi:hypothetical protein